MLEQNFNFEAGEVILVDKPYEWTSFDIVKKIRNTIHLSKIGHAGTLDPLATGLLILCTGKKTKQINTFQDAEKEYTGELVLGATTPSIDLETEIDSETDISHLTEEMIREKTHQFEGVIAQVPPIFSAIKIAGKPVYLHARKGKDIELEPRNIEIKVFEITEIALPRVKFRVVCSKGTYIRSLVRDFGNVLGVGAYMFSLRRTRIGDCRVEDAWKIHDFVAEVKRQKALQTPES